ncbi:type IV toxin-antitoxin system YeeU family antitoxin [Escherichia coli]|uniref:type IV toxin-antitoxin system YeeU family antitoxin n=1 Tax=Escherichia coli TaxID=562 RepID=UPI00098A4477|nr:type IV toxin-antitoxin system YeeU family antitoxin [Escherichia coli]
MSDTLSGTTHPDDNDDHPWWRLPCTVTPCFGARLVQEGNRLHYLADRAGIRGLFSDADAYHLDQAFPTCKADTLGSGGYVYLAVYPTPETKK